MEKLSRSFILGFVLALIVLPSFDAQTASSVPAANPTPTGKAPDEVMKKLSDLVHAGRYDEAQQLTAGLLLAYPDDQRLIKAKVLLDKSLVSSKAAGSNPPANTLVSAALAGDKNAESLTGMDKVDYNALIELARQAQQNTDLEQQKASLKQFMDQSSPFLQKHPDQMLLWQLRAASAISLNDPMAGYDAGQKLLAAGAADSNDLNLQRLLAQLKNTGWLEKQRAEEAKNYNTLLGLEVRATLGVWKSSWAHFETTLTVTVRGLENLKEPMGIRLENVSPASARLDGGDTQTVTIKPGDAVGGTYTTTRKLTSSSGRAFTINCFKVDKTGKDVGPQTTVSY
jgi:hypothetical protein